MLAVSHHDDDHQYHIIHQQREEEEENSMMESFGGGLDLLDSIDFDDLFLGIQEGDVLPDLELDPELLADFSLTGNHGNHESDSLINTSTVDHTLLPCDGGSSSDYSSRKDGGDSSFDQASSRGAEEVVSKMSKEVAGVAGKAGKHKATTGQSPAKNNAQVKRKVKVDWTPELHRRFVQAVEQLGVDKAVPSRILDLMGIHCLTRHNIASHLQKYRSHRKHLLAREAEAACWSKRRQIYGAVPVAPAAAAGGAGGGSKRSRSEVISPWLAVPATMGCFPPPVTATAPVPAAMPHFRPLHVWGHPTTDQSRVNTWQKHHPAAAAWPPPAVVPPPQLHLLPETPPYWPHQRVPNVPSAGGAPCFMPPLILPPPTTMPGIPPATHHGMHSNKLVKATSLIGPHPLDLHPTKESIDAAIDDVISKPWLPMPLGLKPPSVDGVMVELHRHGLP